MSTAPGLDSPAVPQPTAAQQAVLPSGPDDAVFDRPRPASKKPADFWLTIVGSLIGSLGLVWLLYTQILPFTGTVGFVVCWYVAYLAIYAATTSMTNSRPVMIDRLWGAIIAGGAGIVGLALGSTVVYIVIRGWAAVHHLNFWTKPESVASPLTAPLTQGGILNAIVGTLIELFIATAVSLPLGIGTAVYMAEVGGRFSRVVRTVVEAMTALPDILAGLFIYTFLIVTLGVSKSGFAAGVALSVMMLPIIARSADVVLRVVPNGLREASYALGATQWRTVWRVVLPTQRAGLATAVILGMARAVGETAPVFITSGASTYMNPTVSGLAACVGIHTANSPGCTILTQPMNSLPLYIFTAVRSGDNLAIQRGFGAGVALLAIVLILFGTARILSRSKVARR